MTIRRVALGAGVVLLVATVVLAFGPLPGLLLDRTAGAAELEPGERISAESDLRGALLQAVGGLLLVAGAVTAWRQMLIGREQHTLSRRVAVTDAFARAVEQLADDKAVAPRLGGVYSLDRIAEDDPAERARVAEILAAFVREGAAGESAPLPRDVAAALAVLTRQDWPDGADLAGARLADVRLRGARLVRARLDGADLRGADLTCAVLTGARLDGADLRRADLSGAVLRGADLRGALLSGGRADDATRWPEGFAPGEHGLVVRPATDPVQERSGPGPAP
ncbi:pentapeptide repeat-containing protein [Streptomyces aidingensis]|uniref:Pentapeptide repeat-containing protein n=1 Tax=Streptomyces aidingensis TaxID=910347 RepID=A0A1I1QWH2_9ACTN|nr:pentapeptide repeat-containing protein [Streptomyces aidingensis]SFD26436.1 Pentapeptide repeat-containing protein [Streptomyces aidingensis]